MNKKIEKVLSSSLTISLAAGVSGILPMTAGAATLTTTLKYNAAVAAVNKVKTSPTTANVSAAKTAIAKLKGTSKASSVTTLTNQVNAVVNAVAAAVKALNTATTTLTQANIDAAKKAVAVAAVPASYKTSYNVTIAGLQAKLNDLLTPPVVTVTGVTDKQLVNTEVTPVVAVDDANATVVTTLNGASFVSGTKVTAEGVYVLVATATDKAGNVTTQTVNFTIDKTAPTVKAADSKFTNYQTITIVLSEKVAGTPVVKVNGVTEKAENVALSADGKNVVVTKAAGYSAGTYTVVVNGLKDVATNAMAADTVATVVKDASYPATFTNITSGVTNTVKTAYYTAVDQYGQAFDITSADSSYKVTATVNGMPLTSSEYTLSTSNKMLTLTLTLALSKTLVENDALSLKVEKFDKDASIATAKLLSSITSNYTVAKDASSTPKTIAGISASAATVAAGDSVTLTADVRDQFNNPVTSNLRWIVEAGGDLLDASTGTVQSDALTADVTNSNVATFKAIKPGTITISAYNIANGAKATYSVQVAAAKLPTLTLTSTNPATQYNAEDVSYNKVVQNDGAVLTPDMLKFNVVAKTTGTTATDVTVTAAYKGGTGSDKNDIIISAKTAKIGTYNVVAYVGTAVDADGTVKAASFDVTTTLNPTATKVDAITLSTLKVGTAQKVTFAARNSHNEVIDIAGDNVIITVYKNGSVDQSVTVAKLDKDGSAATSAAVKSLSFTASAAGSYTVRVAVKNTVATYDVTAVAEVTTLQSIDLGNDIVDNSVISKASDAVYRILTIKDNKGDSITPDTADWEIATVNGSNTSISDFASIVYYKHDAKGNIVEAIQSTAEGVAVKFDPTKVDYSVDTTLTVTVGNKSLSASDVIKDAFNVTVKAKSAVKSISIADTAVTVIPKASVTKEVVVLDQYGKAITDASMISAAAADESKVTVSVKYDKTAKKMYITYTGVATGTDSVVVKSKADATIKATANITVGDNTTISSIAFDAYGYKVYNDVKDEKDQTAVITYKVNSGALVLPASELNLIYDKDLVTVTTDGATLKVVAKANSASTGIGEKDGVVTISVMTANGKTASIDVTFSDDAVVVDKATVVNKTIDEDASVAGIQTIIGKDKDGNDKTETTAQIYLVGKDQYGNDVDVTNATTWASTDTAIATVDNSGVITKVKAGKTTVTGFYKGNLYSVDVVVPEAK